MSRIIKYQINDVYQIDSILRSFEDEWSYVAEQLYHSESGGVITTVSTYEFTFNTKYEGNFKPDSEVHIECVGGDLEVAYKLSHLDRTRFKFSINDRVIDILGRASFEIIDVTDDCITWCLIVQVLE